MTYSPQHQFFQSSGINRRTFLYSCFSSVSVLALLGAAQTRAQAQSTDSLQDWLKINTIPARTIDARDEDYTDLEPLVGCIGRARVVQLGEPSHSSGSCFAAKARLVKFLHQRMGFGVVVWESGFYDVELVEAGLRSGEDPVSAARRGILPNWASSVEVRPLFEHARESHNTDGPLVMAGFDMTLTAPFADLARELRAFVRAVREEELRNEAVAATEELIEVFGALNLYVEALGRINEELIDTRGAARTAAMVEWERSVGATLRPTLEVMTRLPPAVGAVTTLLETHKAAFARIAGDKRRSFMVRVAANLGGRGANLYERFGINVSPAPDPVDQENRRDSLNAANLRWLIEEGYPDQKLIVWAHNAHVMNAYYLGPDFKRVSLEPATNAMKPHGVVLAEWLGKDLYTIGLTVAGGVDGWVGLQQTRIVPASEGSIEANLHKSGMDYGFLDLRSARGRAGHPLLDAGTVRMPKFDEVDLGNAIGAYDGLFFISRAEPATLIR